MKDIFRHTGESRCPGFFVPWIPAFAGMTCNIAQFFFLQDSIEWIVADCSQDSDQIESFENKFQRESYRKIKNSANQSE